MAKLADDFAVNAWGVEIVLPAGTRLIEVANGMGVIEYAVADVALLQRLTGNTHDPVYRYLFVPGEEVDHDSTRAAIRDACNIATGGARTPEELDRLADKVAASRQADGDAAG